MLTPGFSPEAGKLRNQRALVALVQAAILGAILVCILWWPAL